MSGFLQDLWYDLRAKRLWPVAGALLVALVAVPLLLIESSDAPPPASGAGSGDVQATTAAVNTESSDLDVFKGKDPFRSPAGLRKAASAVTADQLTADSLTATKPSADPSAPSGGSDKTAGGGAGSAAPGSTPQGPVTTKPKTKITRYTYVVDVTFGKNGRLRRYRGLRRLSMLPDEESPLLISLGVDAKADNAVFIVDASVKAEGEGRCPPSGPACALLYLGAGGEELFTKADGDSYILRIDAIRRVKLAKAARASRARARRAKRSARTSARKRLVPPVLTDLEVVASSIDRGSGPVRHRR